jgi:hypothetical protein
VLVLYRWIRGDRHCPTSVSELVRIAREELRRFLMPAMLGVLVVASMVLLLVMTLSLLQWGK